MPVVRDGRLVGIVSRADILRGLATIGRHAHAAPSADDRLIQTEIAQLIRQQTSASLQSVSVIVVNGSVFLWGTAETAADKEAIRVAAENVVGSGKVHDYLNTLRDILRGV